MADQKISELAPTGTLQASDERPIARSGQNYKITAENEAKFFGIKIQLTSVGYIPGATGNADKNKVAPGSDGFYYLFDANGDAIKILDLLAGQVIVEDKYYEHTQGASASTWTVNHNLNKYPAVQAYDSGGTQVPIVEVAHTDVNTCVITLAFSTSGKVYCN